MVRSHGHLSDSQKVAVQDKRGGLCTLIWGDRAHGESSLLIVATTSRSLSGHFSHYDVMMWRRGDLGLKLISARSIRIITRRVSTCDQTNFLTEHAYPEVTTV